MGAILLGSPNNSSIGVSTSIPIPIVIPTDPIILVDSSIQIGESIPIAPSSINNDPLVLTESQNNEIPQRTSIPAGGLNSYVLGKLSNNSFDIGWIEMTGGGNTINGNGLVKATGTTISYITDNSATWNALVSFPGFGSTGSVACVGNDTRLSDSRTPLSHTLEGHTATVSAGGLLKGTGTNTFGWFARGTSLQVLRVNSGGTDLEYVTPPWLTSTGITPAALTKTDDTNITLTLGGTPTTALLQATSLTLGWTGTLADGRITSAATWNAKQTGHANLTSIAALAYVSASFVKMTGANTFSLDTNTYSLSSHTHAESTITFTDITTNNATISQHGYLPKLGGGTVNFLRADGSWTAPSGGSMVYPAGSGVAIVSTGTSWGTTITVDKIPIFASAITGTPSASTFLRGDGTWAAGGSGSSAGNSTDVQFSNGSGGFISSQNILSGSVFNWSGVQLRVSVDDYGNNDFNSIWNTSNINSSSFTWRASDGVSETYTVTWGYTNGFSITKNGATKFNVDNNGNINIPTGSEYRVNGTAITGGGGVSEVLAIAYAIAL